MQMLVVVLLLCFLVSLFCLYCFSNDDFVFLRKNVTIEKMFNLSFLVVFFGILAARIGFVTSHFAYGYLNPLVFFLFPYFPGLSLSAGIAGGALFLAAYVKSSKLPKGRVFDIFSLSFLCALPIGLFFLQLIDFLGKKNHNIFFFAVPLVYIPLFIFMCRLFQKGVFSDGAIGFLSVTCISIISLLSRMLFTIKRGLAIGQEEVVFIILLLISLFFMQKQERFFTRFRKRT